MTFLAKQFFEHSITRKYVALVWGDLQEDGTVTGFIGRDPKDRRVMSMHEDDTKGKWSVTHYKVLERLGFVTLIECELETGRTHQIRTHMKSIGHPLFNDASYGGDRIVKGTVFSKYKQFVDNCFQLLPRQALHAKNLGFIHPISKERVEFEMPLPVSTSGSLIIEANTKTKSGTVKTITQNNNSTASFSLSATYGGVTVSGSVSLTSSGTATLYLL